MPEFGEILGNAVSGNYDQRINDLFRFDEMRRRTQAMNEARTRMLADDLDFKNAANPYDNPKIKEFAKNQILKIGQYIRNNPDYATNLDKMAQLNLMKRELKDNPLLLRGLAVDLAHKEYLKDLQEVAKNPQQHDIDAYNQIGQQFDNYFKHGNINGLEAFNKEGVKMPTYQKPKDFVDINDRWQKIGNSFGDLVPVAIKGGRNAYEEVARPESLQRVAEQEYQQNKRQYDILAEKNGVNPIDYIKVGINSHIKKKRDFGDYGLSDAIYMANYKKRMNGLDRPVNGSAYQEAFVNAPEGVVNPGFLEQTYGSKPQHVIYNNKGEGQIDNTGNRIFYTGVHKWIERKNKFGQPVRQKVVETYTYLPKEDAEQKGIYSNGTFGFGKGIEPEWNKQAEVVTVQDDKGNPAEVVKVKSYMPVEINPAYAGAFDNEVHIAKSKLMAQNPVEQSSIPEGSVDDWKAAGWSDAQIQQGVNEGKIRVR